VTCEGMAGPTTKTVGAWRVRGVGPRYATVGVLVRYFDIISQTFMHGSKVALQSRRLEHLLVGGIQIAEIRANAPSSVIYQPRTYAKINGATIVASDSMMNLGVSTPSFPQVIFSFGTAPEYDP
jgi:hypothetical protein